MSQRVPRAHIRVCPIAQNCLAEAYIHQLLRADPRIDVVSLTDYVKCGSTERKGTIFIIDLFGFEMSLCKCFKRLRGYSSEAKFLVLDKHKSNEEIVRILIMGVHGYVSHAAAPATLIRAIVSVAANQLWVTAEVLCDFLREVNCVLHKNAYGRKTTTPRESEILELMRRRLSNREIADLLQISLSTVKFHVSNILSKLHAKNRRHLKENAGGSGDPNFPFESTFPLKSERNSMPRLI